MLCLAALLTSVYAQNTNPTPPSQAPSSAMPSGQNMGSMPSANGESTTNSAGSLSHRDINFIKKAARSNMKEVEVAQAVLPKLTNPKVRDFAQMMVNDHTQANSELQTLAQAKQVPLPEAMGKWAQKWAAKNSDVDKDYIKEMVSDHKEAVKLFKKASKSEDPQVAAYAQKTLPTLEHHLKVAKGLKSELSGGSGASTSETGGQNGASPHYGSGSP